MVRQKKLAGHGINCLTIVKQTYFICMAESDILMLHDAHYFSFHYSNSGLSSSMAAYILGGDILTTAARESNAAKIRRERKRRS